MLFEVVINEPEPGKATISLGRKVDDGDAMNPPEFEHLFTEEIESLTGGPTPTMERDVADVLADRVGDTMFDSWMRLK